MKNLKTKSARKFMHFLKDNDAVAKYMKYMHYPCMTFDEVTKQFKKEQYILNSFTWSNTKEGHEYWSILHDKWLSFLLKQY